MTISSYNKDIDSLKIEVISSKKGNLIPVINIESKKLSIHSKFDPEKEAERFINEIDTTKHNLFIVFGWGFAYHIEKLLEKIDSESRILVIEKYNSIFKESISHRDLSAILSDKRLSILVSPEKDDIIDSLKDKSSSKVKFITHRGSFQIDPDYYTNILEITRASISTKEVNIATLAKFERTWSSNIARNIVTFFKTPGANIFYNKFNKIPAIVVSAGPSLTKSLDFIKANRERAIIISVDTAYSILQRNGITPHFLIAVDPQVINARYFEGVKSQGTILITDPTIHPSVHRLFNGKIATTGIVFKLMKWIENFISEKGEISHGGSVSTNAYDFAKRIGAAPMIMVGQDLAFTDGLAHAKGSYLDEQIHMKSFKLNTPQMFNRRQLSALPKIFVKGIRRDKVHTNQKMMIFHSWFEKKADKDLINSTYDGVYINGIDHITMENLEINWADINIPEKIDKIFNEGIESIPELNSIRTKAIKKLDSMLKDIESIIPVLEKAIEMSKKLSHLITNKIDDIGKVNFILKKLSDSDTIIESKKNIMDMISFTTQRVIQTIKEGYEIDEEDKNLTEEELTVKKSEYLYNGLYKGALFNRKILTKMKKILT